MNNAAKDGMILVTALRNPPSVARLDADGWACLLTIARAELLIGTLAHRLEGQQVPDRVSAILADARINAGYQRRSALWEAECAARALSTYDGRMVLMKGTAYVASDLRAGIGRSIGDLDIMVAESDLQHIERLLMTKGGWEWVKEDAYDDAYYRTHMHELPPMIHKERDRMIDVHHTILPKTAGPAPDPAAILASAQILPIGGKVATQAAASNDRQGAPTDAASQHIARLAASAAPRPSLSGEELFVFAPADMAVHCAAHLIADGELDGGLRNLWDFHCLFSEFSAADTRFEAQLLARADHHQLRPAVQRACRLANHLYGERSAALTITDRLFIRRMTARDYLGRGTRKATRLAFYIRSHLLRMPPVMLARHLWTKWRRGS